MLRQYTTDLCSENKCLHIENTKINSDLSKAMKDKYDAVIKSGIKQI